MWGKSCSLDQIQAWQGAVIWEIKVQKNPTHKVHIRCCLELSAGRNLMHGINSQKYFMGQRRLLSCQNQSCLPVVLNYTLTGAIKQPKRAAHENRTWVRVVGLLCLQPQSPVHWRTSTRHSSLTPAAWIHDKQICNKSGPTKSYSQAYAVLAWSRQHAHLWHSNWKIPIPTGKY